MTKTFSKKEIKEKFLQLVKTISNKPKDKIILNAKYNAFLLNAFTLRSRTQKSCFLSLLLFNSIVRDLPNKIRVRNKRYINWEGKK